MKGQDDEVGASQRGEENRFIMFTAMLMIDMWRQCMTIMAFPTAWESALDDKLRKQVQLKFVDFSGVVSK